MANASAATLGGRTLVLPLRRGAQRTVKICISLDREDLAVVRRRAERVYGGDISKAIAEAVQYLRYEEGREALLEAFGDEAMLTPEGLESIASEWGLAAEPRAKKRRRRAA